MSYTMTHLMITDQYRIRHDIPTPEAEVFLLASISPDAVHASSNFVPAMKEKSHIFPERLPWGDITTEEQMDDWYENIKAFYQTRMSPVLTSLEKAYLQGYMLHLLVDIFNCSYIYAPNLIQYGHDVVHFRRDYRAQSMNQDQYLYENYGRTEELFRELETGALLVEKYPILKNLRLDHMLNSDMLRENILRNRKVYKATQCVDIKAADMITEELTKRFIQDMGSMCDELLFELPDREHLFRVRQAIHN